jgi:uncharacterized membrane protein YqjE
MVLAESAARLAATLLAIVQTRLDLAATEVEEESLRYFTYLVLALAALFCVGLAVVLGTILLVVIYWESNRTGVLLALTMLFAVIGIALGIRVRSLFQQKPKLMKHTMSELARDADMLQPPA